ARRLQALLPLHGARQLRGPPVRRRPRLKAFLHVPPALVLGLADSRGLAVWARAAPAAALNRPMPSVGSPRSQPVAVELTYASRFGGLWTDRSDADEELARRAASGGLGEALAGPPPPVV